MLLLCDRSLREGWHNFGVDHFPGRLRYNKGEEEIHRFLSDRSPMKGGDFPQTFRSVPSTWRNPEPYFWLFLGWENSLT